MPSNQAEWDAKHGLAAETPPSEPASIICELLPLLPSGQALDIACGTGRNALFLAARGQHVTAVDFSGVALDILEVRAHGMHVPVRRGTNFHDVHKAHRRGLELLRVDLQHAHLPAHAFDLIVCIQFLQRSLFPQMVRALRPNGVLVLETYTRAQLEFPEGPRNPAFLLEIGELRDAFPSLCVLFYRELRAGQGIASLVARKQDKRG